MRTYVFLVATAPILIQSLQFGSSSHGASGLIAENEQDQAATIAGWAAAEKTEDALLAESVHNGESIPELLDRVHGLEKQVAQAYEQITAREKKVAEAKTDGIINEDDNKKTTVGEIARPHILFMLVDDLGWADVSFNRDDADKGLPTPNMDNLAAQGVTLKRHYVHKTCSPTRSAIQSGRSPIHVNVLNLQAFVYNPNTDSAAGIPRNMTGMAEVLRNAGYATHMVGKWDAGMATPDHTPAGRGYQSSLVYYNHDTDCWSFKATRSPCQTLETNSTKEWKEPLYFTDLWEHDESIKHPGRPAKDFLNVEDCSYDHQNPQGGGACKFMDIVFEERVRNIIRAHDSENPFFIFWAFRSIHADYQPPVAETDGLASSLLGVGSSLERQYYLDRSDYFGMVRFVDGSIGRVVSLLKHQGFYDNTLIVFSSDNGGTPGGNSYPLRGSKWSNFEGGIRVPAFVSGGFLPEDVRGSSRGGLVAAWDWYATFASIAGAYAWDMKAAAAGLPEIDSINVWPYISGQTTTSPRDVIFIGDVIDDLDTKAEGQTTVGGIILQQEGKLMKLLLGMGESGQMRCAAWGSTRSFTLMYTEKRFPTAQFCDVTQVCGSTPETGCLFDLAEDPGETQSIAARNPDVFYKLMKKIVAKNETVFSEWRGLPKNSAMCEKGRDDYQGFWGPFAA